MNQVTTSPKLYIGIDIHKRSWKIHCSTDLFSGKTFSMEPSSEQLKNYVDKHYQGYESVQVCYEAGCCGYKWHREFESYGWQSIVVNPADVARKGKHQFQKTDKIDAQLLSRELKDGRLEGIFVPKKIQEDLRSLFRRRNDLVKDFRRIKSRIKMQLLGEGIKIPDGLDTAKWTHKFRNWLKSLTFKNETLASSLKSRIKFYDYVEEEIRMISNQLRAYCRKNLKTDYYLLRSVPGIGGIVAVGILAELGDLRRFKNFKQLSSYVGLVPGIYQSGEKMKAIGKTQRAHRLMRSYFIEASWQAIRADPIMQAYYRKHLGKDTKKIIFKVAHKLLSRVFAVIKTGKHYEIGIVE